MAIPGYGSIALVGSFLLLGLAPVPGAETGPPGDNFGALKTPAEAVRPGVTEEQLFTELASRNGQRSETLLGYDATRTYRVSDLEGKIHAQEVGCMEYRAPGQKTFVITSEAGSGLVRRLALTPLIESEIRTAAGKEHHDSSITPANYNFRLLGEQQVGPYRCFVVQATPKRVDKYLFEGRVWIDAGDYAIVRIEGHPAANLSFWIKTADFVREYQKIDGFWLPQRDETVSGLAEFAVPRTFHYAEVGAQVVGKGKIGDACNCEV